MKKVGEVNFKDVKKSSGPAIKSGDTICIHYSLALNEEALENKELIETTLNSKNPVIVKVSPEDMVAGVYFGITGMKSGGSVRRIFVPAELAFGRRGIPEKIPADSSLVYEITLMYIVKGD